MAYLPHHPDPDFRPGVSAHTYSVQHSARCRMGRNFAHAAPCDPRSARVVCHAHGGCGSRGRRPLDSLFVGGRSLDSLFPDGQL